MSDRSPPLDLDAARAALALVAARPPAPDRLLLAWHADLYRDLHPEVEPDPLDLILPFGALSPEARALLGLLVATAREVPSMRAAAGGRGPAAFVDAAAALAERLPPAVVRAHPLRQEELLRRWAAQIDAPLRVADAPEPPDRATRVLERLDYARIRAEEQRLEDERAVAEARRAALAKVAAGGPL